MLKMTNSEIQWADCVFPPGCIIYSDEDGVFICDDLPSLREPRYTSLYFISAVTPWYVQRTDCECVSRLMRTFWDNIGRQRMMYERVNCADLMRHDRRHKKSGGFSRENTATVTDYAGFAGHAEKHWHDYAAYSGVSDAKRYNCVL